MSGEPPGSTPKPPTGTVTFLLTDIEGSTHRWQEDAGMPKALARHDEIIRGAIETNDGYIVKHTGDGILAAFASASGAVLAAITAQESLGREQWGQEPLRARMGIHTGEAEERDGDYFGLAVSLTARFMEAAHGGQILASGPVRSLLTADDYDFRDLGEHPMRGLAGRYPIFQVTSESLPTDFPPLRIAGETPVNLPAPRTSFIGRKEALDKIDRLLGEGRLVTLTGVGGCGKTRLAIEVARHAIERLPGGVFFADLSPLTEPAQIPREIAETVGMNFGGGMGPVSARPLEEDLVAFFRARRCLLVVDNCEHLLDACAEMIDGFLSACPELHVLATSRESLRLDGERAWGVPPLKVPDVINEDGEAVELLLDRALAVRPDLDTDAQREALVEIARRLDGIPLALELAAATMAYMSPTEVAERIDDRFRLLTGGTRRTQRQRTLEAAIDWSYDLLDENERTLLRRLAVFAGSFTLEAAEGICGEDPVVLGSLVRKSLVNADEDGVETRYRMLETVRHYAEDRLVDSGEAEQTRGRHRDWFLGWVESFSIDQAWLSPFVFSAMHREIDNLRAALNWSRAERRHDLVARMASGMVGMFVSGGYTSEGWGWLQFAQERELDPPLRPLVTLAAKQVSLIGLLEEPDEVRAFFTDRFNYFEELPDQDPMGAMAMILRANIFDLGYAFDPDTAERTIEEARRRADATGLTYLRVFACNVHAWVLLVKAQPERALETLDEAKTILGDRPDFWVSMGRSIAAHLSGRHDVAVAEAEAVEEVTRQAMAKNWVYMSPFLKSVALAGKGDIENARISMTIAIERIRSAPFELPLALADCAVGCAACACHEGEMERASTLLASVRGTPGFWVRTPASFALYTHYRNLLREGLDPETRHRLVAEGEALGIDDAIDAELALWETRPLPA